MIRWFLQLSPHLRLAIVLAPFLGLLGFGLADLWLSQEPQKPAPKVAQPPVAMHEFTLNEPCRLDAARCVLSAGDMQLMLQSAPTQRSELLRIDISASGHVRGLQLALVQGEHEARLVAQRTPQTQRWFVEFPRALLRQPTFTLRLALAQTKRVYLAEFAARF